MGSIEEVFEEMDVLIDMHFFNEILKTKSSSFPNKVMASKNVIDV